MPASILLHSSPSFLPPSPESCRSLASPSPPLGQTRPAKSCNRRNCSWNAPLSSLPPHLGEVNNDPDYDIKITLEHRSRWSSTDTSGNQRCLMKVEQILQTRWKNSDAWMFPPLKTYQQGIFSKIRGMRFHLYGFRSDKINSSLSTQ